MAIKDKSDYYYGCIQRDLMISFRKSGPDNLQLYFRCKNFICPPLNTKDVNLSLIKLLEIFTPMN